MKSDWEYALSGSDYWDDLAEDYAPLYDTPWAHSEDILLQNDLVALALAYPNARVLDIGCGTGLAYRLVNKVANLQYTGVDISEAMLSHFKNRHPEVRLLAADARNIITLFEPRSFDIVLSTNVVASFVGDVQDFLRQVHSVLVPGGTFYLSFLNRVSLRRLLRFKIARTEWYRSRGDTTSEAPVAALTYSSRYLLRACNQAGFVHLRHQHRSVLGGVWETAMAIPLERHISSLFGHLGHEVIVSGMRRLEQAA